MGELLSLMSKVLDRGLKVSVFEHQSRYYVDFRTNTFGKDITHLWVNSIIAVLLQR